ncbi:MAG: hypothetical protein QN152_13470 [Armatimonadota bacterium]|nr:hypothetical protein [Armatimonadota bacterium]MDR7540513.1 hypothetical protein [Armatimonadota bacterium]
MVRSVSRPREPLAVEVLTPLLGTWRGTRVREWSQARGDYYRLWQLLDAIGERFRGRVTVYIVDPVSLPGVLRITRHRIRGFPAFVIGGREKYTGWDLEELARRIERHLAAD